MPNRLGSSTACDGWRWDRSPRGSTRRGPARGGGCPLRRRSPPRPRTECCPPGRVRPRFSDRVQSKAAVSAPAGDRHPWTVSWSTACCPRRCVVAGQTKSSRVRLRTESDASLPSASTGVACARPCWNVFGALQSPAASPRPAVPSSASPLLVGCHQVTTCWHPLVGCQQDTH